MLVRQLLVGLLVGLSWDFGPEILSSVPAPMSLNCCVIKCVIIHNTLMNKETVPTKSVEVLRLNEA